MWASWTIQYGQSLTSRPDGQMMNIFLRQFSRQLSDNVHAVLLWDAAGCHKSKNLRKPQNITIIELPAYSPELNPVENLWQYLCSYYWSNSSYENYDDSRLAACDAWQEVCLDTGLVHSICRCTYVERTN